MLIGEWDTGMRVSVFFLLLWTTIMIMTAQALHAAVQGVVIIIIVRLSNGMCVIDYECKQ